MDDQILMRVLDRLADSAEELQPLRQRQLLLDAVIGDWLAGDVLHDEVRPAVGGRPAFEQARRRKDAPARPESVARSESDAARTLCRDLV